MHSDDGSLGRSARDRGDVRRSGVPSHSGGSASAGEVRAPLQVVIAEDMALIAMDLEHQVEGMGHEVVASVTTADAVVSVARRAPVDVVLMDIRLGHGSDGVAAAIILYREFGIRSIFISAHADAHTRARAAEAQPLGFLPKPLSPTQLARQLRQLSASPAAPEPASSRFER